MSHFFILHEVVWLAALGQKLSVDNDMVNFLLEVRIASRIYVGRQVVLCVNLCSCGTIIDNYSKTLAICQSNSSNVIVKRDIGDIRTNPFLSECLCDKLSSKRILVQVMAGDTVMPSCGDHTRSTLLQSVKLYPGRLIDPL